MTPGFSNLPFEGSTLDGLNWTVSKPLWYTTADGRVYRVRPGATTDGPSVPQAAESLLSRTGPQWLCGVLHDAAYREALEVQEADGGWSPANLTKAEADSLFREALLAQGLSVEKADIFYEAVHVFGEGAFEEDRKQTAT